MERQFFIEEFLIPATAEKEFLSRANYNRDFIKTLPGFLKDEFYCRKDDTGNLVYLTIAVWQNRKALTNAKQMVQEEYKHIGFKPQEMFNRLGVSSKNGVFSKVNRI